MRFDIEVHVTVRFKKHANSEGKTYSKTIAVDQAPSFSDEIIPFQFIDGADFLRGPRWPVKQRYLDYYGDTNIVLADVIVNPDVTAVVAIQESEVLGECSFIPWFPADGDVIDFLEKSGWKVK